MTKSASSLGLQVVRTLSATDCIWPGQYTSSAAYHQRQGGTNQKIIHMALMLAT